MQYNHPCWNAFYKLHDGGHVANGLGGLRFILRSFPQPTVFSSKCLPKSLPQPTVFSCNCLPKLSWK